MISKALFWNEVEESRDVAFYTQVRTASLASPSIVSFWSMCSCVSPAARYRLEMLMHWDI
jgi:hypothetical protein